MDEQTTSRCTAEHNPLVWPYVSRCTKPANHDGKHIDKLGNEWE